MHGLIISIHLCLLCYRTSIVPSKYLMTMMIIVMMISFYIFSRQVSDFSSHRHTVSHFTDPKRISCLFYAEIKQSITDYKLHEE